MEELLELENKRVHALKLTRENKQISEEKKKLIALIKTLQADYLKKGLIERRSYDIKLESYHKRLTEIDENLATLEAKKAFKKKKLKNTKLPKK